MEYTVGVNVFGDWTIIRKLGEGASGRVYEIQKEIRGLILKSALKVIQIPKSEDEVRQVLSEGMDEASVSDYFMQAVDDIEKEVRIMMNLKDNENIVRCEDYQFIANENGIGGSILIRMELLTSLRDYQMYHPMKEPEVLRMAEQLCQGLQYCHEKGLIHRDIKPENIFVNEAGQFKLGDFGVAKTIEKSTGGVSKKGTESYMAPEVYIGKEYGKNVDLYSLGLVLYKLMNRDRLPFFPITGAFSYSEKEEALAKRLQGEKLTPPIDASKEFGEVILKACAYRPQNRYQTSGELLNALKKLEVGSEAVISQNSNVWKRWTALAAGGILVTGGLLSFLYMGGHKDEYQLTVQNGSGSGKYTEGEQVHIIADEPKEGYQFSGWTTKSKTWAIPDDGSKEISFEMPDEEVVLMANYKPTIESDTSAENATSVITTETEAIIEPSIPSIPPIPSIPDELFQSEPTADSVEAKCLYSVIVNNGTGMGPYHAGEKVYVAADEAEAGYEFSDWTADTDEFLCINYVSPEISFIMPEEDVILTANYKKTVLPTVTVNNGTGSGQYEEGEIVKIKAIEPLNGYEFSGWTVEKGSCQTIDTTSPELTFLMPAEEIILTANYEPK